MARPIWLALIFLVVVCALAALKFSIATPPKQQAAFAEDVIETHADALAKADKLEVEEIPDKKTIRSIAISIPEKATKIVSRDWQDGFAKAKMREHHHRHVFLKGRPAGLKAKK
jgi:uncharacterized protein YpmB